MLGDATISVKFWKGGIGEFKEFLPHIFIWSAYHAPCQKRLCNIKYGFEGSISNVDMTCFSQTTNWCSVLWHFGSVKSFSSVPNLPRHSAMLRHIYVFSIFLGKNNVKAIKFLGIIKPTFPRIRKHILLFKKKNVLLNKKVIFVFLTILRLKFHEYFLYYHISCIIILSVLSFSCIIM